MAYTEADRTMAIRHVEDGVRRIKAMRDSVASNNTNNGVIALSTAGGALDVSIDDSMISGNGIYGIRSEGSAAAIVRISNTTITGNNPSPLSARRLTHRGAARSPSKPQWTRLRSHATLLPTFRK